MREQPEGQQLLACARATLLEKIVPLLPQDQRYNALMIANAMAIALRQWDAGDAWQQEELARLQTLLATEFTRETGNDLHQALRAANRALAQRIRCGQFDKPSQDLANLLQWMATQRVIESAPKALQTPR